MIYVKETTPGTCWRNNGDEVPQQRVDCSDEHEVEVLHRLNVFDYADYPGNEFLTHAGIDMCTRWLITEHPEFLTTALSKTLRAK
ncbi:hypothetical protein [Actinomyces vulturis]|uniref:hypothetical protein n=1 Tax=Actinomyces vulturis TaxID=1857645 RepID=UPI00082B8896|nr:hypothetical protein [Actinomyces vulturis]